MPKRIALFILGVVIAVGAFLLYQLITGASIGPTVKPRGLAVTESTNSGIDITEMDGEKPVYEITASGSPEQIKDAAGNPRPGQFRLHQLVATWYDKTGRTLEIRGDTCEIQMAPGTAGAGILKGSGAGSSGPRLTGTGAGGKDVDITRLHWEDFSGTLRDHVYLTISPLPINPRNATAKDPLPAGLRIYFDEPLHLDGSQSLLTTTGGIHIRSTVIESDGKGLQLVLNPYAKPQRIEKLLLEDNPAGNQIIFRNAGSKVAAMTNRTAATKKATTAPAPAPDTALALAPAPTTQKASTKPAKPKEPSGPPVTYELSFGEKISAVTQQGTLTSDRLYLRFMPTRGLADTDTTSSKSDKPGAVAPVAATTASAPAPFPDDPAPILPVKPDDLAVTWSGPMELSPLDPEEASQLALRGPDDFALKATGTAQNPVTLTQHTTRTTTLASATGEKSTVPSRDSIISIRAGLLLYPGQDRPITISPGDVAQVVLHQIINNLLKPGDVSDQQITCGEVVYTPDTSGLNKDHAVLAGPGTLQSQTPNEELTTNWATRMDVDLEPPPDARGGNERAIARAVLQGAAISSRGSDSDLDMSAQVLDVQIANFVLDGKAQQAPQKLFAQGGVVVKTWKKEAAGTAKGAPRVVADDRKDKPDGIQTDSLTILSKVAPGSPGPVLSQMIADGHVAAWRYSSGSNDLGLGAAPDAAANAAMTTRGGGAIGAPREWTKNSLITPHLVTDLSAKASTATRPAAGETANAFDSAVGNVEPAHVVATGGVRVLIEPPTLSQRLPVDLTADALDADPIHLSAHFTASKEPGAPLVIAKRGNDSITAAAMDLSQSKENSKHDILDIPVPGSFAFLSREAADKAPRTYLASWTDSMHYDSLEQLATIKGHPIVRVEGDNQELDSLRCDELLNIHLKPRPKTPEASVARAGRSGTPARAGADDMSLDLDWLEAVGQVEASGTLLASEKKPATRPGDKGEITVAQTRPAQPEKLLEMYVTANDDTEAGHPKVPGRLKFNSATQSFEIPGSGALRIMDHRPRTAGESVFGWKQAMKFDGGNGTVQFSRDVDLFFTPEKGFNFLTGITATAPAPDKESATAKTEKHTAHLHTDQLTAKLLKAQTTATPSSSPIAFDAASLESVTAAGSVQITFDDLVLNGVRLTYDMPTQIATIFGTEDELATAQRNGVLVEADSYILDTTKDKLALTAKNPRGDLIGLDLPQ